MERSVFKIKHDEGNVKYTFMFLTKVTHISVYDLVNTNKDYCICINYVGQEYTELKFSYSEERDKLLKELEDCLETFSH